MKFSLDKMHGGSEVVHYDIPDIPLYIQKRILSSYVGMRADCHWHEDLEMIYLLEGEMYYYVNGQKILLRKSEGIIVNSKVIHYGYDHNGQECVFLCILFRPELLHGNTPLYQNYIEPVLNEQLWEFWKLTPAKDNGIIEMIKSIWKAKENASPAYELEVIGCLYSLWPILLEHCQNLSADNTRTTSPDVIIMKKLVAYIHQHYAENISLEDLCRYAGIGKSTCCNLFKKHTSHSPIDFVNQYRLKTAANLLITTDKSVTEIAMECGFSHHSYFTKSFHKLFGCVPSKFQTSAAAFAGN